MCFSDKALIKTAHSMLHYIASLLITSLLWCAGIAHAQQWSEQLTSDNSSVVARHETGYVVDGDNLYVMGGRGDRPVQVYNTSLNSWATLAPLPIQMHHFQPVVLNGHIYIIGAFTGFFPSEINVQDIYRYNLENDFWEIAGQVPTDRLRGSAAATVHNGKIYLLGGNTSGHLGGFVAWLDEYDPVSDTWITLDDAPNARDHFSVAVVGDKLVAAGGRQSDFSTSMGFSGTVAQTDVYDFSNGSWSTAASIPTPRAGNMVGVSNGNLIIMGGESATQPISHSEVEAFNVENNIWRSLPGLNMGRHGGAGGVINDSLHAVTGNLVRGGGQETIEHEVLNLSDVDNDGLFDFEDDTNDNLAANTDTDSDGLSDAEEVNLGTDPSENDTDSDSINDGDEVIQFKTDPLNSDTDGDNLSDFEEIDQHQTSPLLIDSDSDGLSDEEEIGLGTNPNSADSDVDGLSDIDELQVFKTNPSNRDTDGDGLFDKDELDMFNTDPLLKDSDNDGLTDDVEILEFNSDPNDWDSDSDGISDATEVAEGSNPTEADAGNNTEAGTGVNTETDDDTSTGTGTDINTGTNAATSPETGTANSVQNREEIDRSLNPAEGNTDGGLGKISGGASGGGCSVLGVTASKDPIFPLTIGFLMIQLYSKRKRKSTS